MWDERYREPGYAYGKEPNDFLVSVADRLRGRALCLAEGEGRNAVYLAKRGLDVTAVDQSAVGLEKAQALARERGAQITTERADLADYAIAPAAWDAVVEIWCHVPRALRARMHADVVRGLASGGYVVIESYTPAQIALGTGGPKSVDLLATLADLKSELAGLEIVVGRELEREVHEGPWHDGKSAVVQILARKP